MYKQSVDLIYQENNTRQLLNNFLTNKNKIEIKVDTKFWYIMKDQYNKTQMQNKTCITHLLRPSKI